jgi:nitrile hydratase subunit beta
MSRLNDVGGMHGFGPIERTAGEPPFHAEWEARVFALNRLLMLQSIYNLDELRAAVEEIEPARYLAMPYYERWLTAIEALLAKRGIAP